MQRVQRYGLHPLIHGKPITFGTAGEKAVNFEDGQAKIVDTSSVESSRILVHDQHRTDPTVAFALSRLSHGPYGPTRVGIFRAVSRPLYETMMSQQLVDPQAKRGPGELAQLISSAGTWEVK